MPLAAMPTTNTRLPLISMLVSIIRPLAKVATGSYHGTMRAVGIKILKNKLSEYVRAAAAGEIILVLDRERVVAELHPPAANRPRLGVDARLAEQIRLGNITPPLKPGAGPLPRRHPMVSFEQLMRDIEADREDRDLPR